jgi:catechol 2,3-dioxygenase-like lactoylglutathione lyase family enzyme
MSATPTGPRLQRATLVVADLERALGFYRDVLGLSVAYVLAHRDESYSIPVFDIPAGARLRFCTLSSPTQERCLALTEVTGAPLYPVPRPRRAAVVMEVPEPDRVVAGAQALGLQVYPEEVLKTPDGRVGREIGIVDADDHLVVIYTITGRSD